MEDFEENIKRTASEQLGIMRQALTDFEVAREELERMGVRVTIDWPFGAQSYNKATNTKIKAEHVIAIT